MTTNYHHGDCPHQYPAPVLFDARGSPAALPTTCELCGEEREAEPEPTYGPGVDLRVVYEWWRWKEDLLERMRR